MKNLTELGLPEKQPLAIAAGYAFVAECRWGATIYGVGKTPEEAKEQARLVAATDNLDEDPTVQKVLPCSQSLMAFAQIRYITCDEWVEVDGVAFLKKELNV